MPPLIRRFPTNDSDISALTLIDGGRWLLVVSRFGSVSYYDLDTQEPVKRLLIPAVRLESRDDYFPCTAMMAVDMDNDSALLSFNLALYTCKSGNSRLFYNFRWLTIYRPPFHEKHSHSTYSSLARNSQTR